MKAVWNGQLLADSDETIVIEGNHYFPPGAVQHGFFKTANTHTICPWKGEASYYDIVVGGQVNKDAAWYYPQPLPGALKRVGKDFANYVAFWHGVEVS